MNTFVMILTGLNLILLTCVAFILFLRIKEKKEDTRITKGLQLLQHKIAILQDLSDKADEQVHRLVHVLEAKSNELKKMTTEANLALQNMTSNIQLTNSLPANPATSPPGARGFNSRHENFEMDDFTQFVDAIQMQNEKMRPADSQTPRTKTSPFIAATENIPQTFVSVGEEAKPAEIRPFNFRRLDKKII